MDIKKQIIYINGLHCQGCKVLLESEVGAMPGVKWLNVDYRRGTAELKYDPQLTPFAKVVKTIENLGYQVNSEPKDGKRESGLKGFFIGLLVPAVAVGLIAGYFILTRSGALGILAKVNEQHISFGLIFLIGVLASFHCVAMCGGLVVAYSASHSLGGKNKSLFWPHLEYNAGRLVSYSVVGGVLGGLGSFFRINPFFSGSLMFGVGIFMIVLALSLFFQISWTEILKIKLPATVCKFVFREQKKSKGPLVVGLLTGLMPCGPLQAMQFYALGTGSVIAGAASLAVYALGTAPVMMIFGATVSKLSHKYLVKMFRLSGVIVMILGLLMISRGVASLSITTKIDTAELGGSEYVDESQVQIVKMAVTNAGYQPNVMYVKKGILVRWIIDGSGISGCTNAIQIPSLGIKKNLTKGENIIEFTPTEAGEIPFSCWMQMVWGKFIVQ